MRRKCKEKKCRKFSCRKQWIEEQTENMEHELVNQFRKQENRDMCDQITKQGETLGALSFVEQETNNRMNRGRLFYLSQTEILDIYKFHY